MSKNLLLSLGLVTGMALAGTASASNIDFFTGGADVTMGTSHNFGGIVATGYTFTYTGAVGDFSNISWNLHDLYQSNTGAHSDEEVGLGVKGGGSRELNQNEFIKLDFAGLPAGSDFFSERLELTMSSVQSGEAVSFFLGHPFHNDATYVGDLTGDGDEVAVFDLFDGVSLLAGANKIYIVGKTADVMLKSISTVPEPSTLFLMGLGLVGLGTARARRRG